MIKTKLVRATIIAGAAAIVGATVYFALRQSNFDFGVLTGASEETDLKSFSANAILLLGLIFGLKHATEADHVVAVGAIVSEQHNVWRAAIVGALWGVGHTVSLIVVGAFVLLLRMAISEKVTGWLEFAVAIMIVALGANALYKALRARSDTHFHQHSHGDATHAHVHFHDHANADLPGDEKNTHSHRVSRVGVKPIVVGAIHGLAGSAALTLLVLTQIDSPVVGLLYLLVFGVGSIAGMLLMSGLVGLPFALAARGAGAWSKALQTIAGAASVVFGLYYAYEIGAANNLFS